MIIKYITKLCAIMLPVMLCCLFAACGIKDTKEAVYEDDRYLFSVEIPSDWTSEAMEQDAEASCVGMEIYIDGSAENKITVFRERERIHWNEGRVLKEIQLNDSKALLLEEETERDGSRYVSRDVIIRPFHCISMCLRKDVYEANEKEIDAMIQSFTVYR